MTVTLLQTGPAVWWLCGELDAAGVPGIVDRLVSVDGDVELDCSGLTFVDAGGLRLLVEVHRSCERRGAKLAIVDPAPCVMRLIRLTGLGALLTVRAMVRLGECD
jgi:anti-anti-sigma factor